MPHNTATAGMNQPVVDYFQLLDLPRHPWVDPAALKAKYHAMVSQRHPDQAGGSQQRFILLGEAVACLKEMHSRLGHLIDLEFPEESGSASIRPDDQLFQAVAGSLENARIVRQELRRATTKLAVSTGLAKLAKSITALQKQLTAVRNKRAEQEQLCRDAGSGWALRGARYWREEATRARYYAKWQKELEETLFICNNLRSTHR